MSIIKSKHASDYTILPNSIFKQGLSLQAVGTLAYLLSLPHDWVVYKTLLPEQIGCGKYELDSAFKELKKAGYIISVRKINGSGHKEWEHIVYDKPFNGEPYAEKPNMDSPYREKSDVGENPMSEKTDDILKKQEQIQKKQATYKKETDYQLAVDFWLKEFHIGWDFNSTTGVKMKSILKKIEKLIISSERERIENDVSDAFKFICLNLPDFFKDKDLQVIDSKFNEIIEQIKNKKNGQKDSNGKPVSKYHN